MAILKYKSNTGEWVTIEPGLDEQAVQSLINSSLPTYTDTEGATAAVGGFAVGDTAEGMTFQEFAYKLLHPTVEPTPITAPECYINLVPTLDTTDPEKIVSIGFDNDSWIRKTNQTSTTPGADLTDIKVYINNTLVDTFTSEELYEANNNPAGFKFSSKVYTVTPATSSVTVKVIANEHEFTDSLLASGITPVVQFIAAMQPDADDVTYENDTIENYHYTTTTSVDVSTPVVRIKRGTKDIVSIKFYTNNTLVKTITDNELTEINSSLVGETTIQSWFNYNGASIGTITEDTELKVEVEYQGTSDKPNTQISYYYINILFE